MDEDPASCKFEALEKRSNQPKYKEPRTRSPKTNAKLIYLKQRVSELKMWFKAENT